MRAADPASAPFEAQISGNPFDWHAETASRFAADAAIEAIRAGLIRYFVEDNSADRQCVRDLRRRIADRIEADLALLDALDGDTDLEDGHDAEGNTDDNGLGDSDALSEQGFRGYGGCL